MSSFDTVIVGAGAAGIAATRRLVAAGRKVLVLEARNRAGGRAHTDMSLGFPADLGAAWLHFADQNAWTRIAEAAGSTVLRSEPGWGAAAGVGAHFPSAEERDAAAANYQRYYELIEASAAGGKDVPLSDILPQDRFRTRFDATMTWAVGVESHQVSTLDLSRYAESDHNWAVREGLGTVIAGGAAGLPIRLACEVTAIDWSSTPLRIDCRDGRVEAASAIITLPTAVLAQGMLRFSPALPADCIDAFHKVPLGVVNKVFFRLAAGQLAEAKGSHFIGTDRSSRTCSYIMRPAQQPLLCAFFGGDLSRELEQRGELAHFARDELRGIFGATFADGLGTGIETGWGMDPLARGSYSAAMPGSADCRATLARPVNSCLQFAGEACSTSHYGTVHGAWLSGVAAADRLLQGDLLR